MIQCIISNEGYKQPNEDNMKQITKSKIVFYLMKKHGIGAYLVEETTNSFKITKNGMLNDIAVHIMIGYTRGDNHLNMMIDAATSELNQLLDVENNRLTKKLMDSIGIIEIPPVTLLDIDDSVLR